MVDWESARRIEVLNKHLGMEHRIKEYDLRETADLKAALEFAVAAYCDYLHYHSVLGNLVEKFDESIEYFDPVTWVNMSEAPEKADALTLECASALSGAYYRFIDLVSRSSEHLSRLLKITVTAPTVVQNEILGSSYYIAPSEIDGKLELLLDALDAADYCDSIPENFCTFLKTVKEAWAEPPTENAEEEDTPCLPF